MESKEKQYKMLLLLRHAKSSWKDEDISDHERPLNKRGKKDAPKIGKLLKNLNLTPDKIISSSAKRAIDTAKLVSKNCKYNNFIEVNTLLYGNNPDYYLKIISMVSNQKNRLLVVGHNPVIEKTVELLTNQIERIPTCTLVQINLSINDWKSIYKLNPTESEIVNIWRPKEI